ncbi:GHKL domain-containing protein [Candidatus Sumerlaeota bacterium]|nr:GHKL domain-containing protein [Candidatus Sumerlaeota bacterium]
MKWALSLRTKVIFAALACVLLLAFCLTLVTLYVVEARKQQIVARAREMVEARADQVRQQFEKLLEDEKAGDIGKLLKESERARRALQLIVTDRDNRILFSLIYNDANDRVEYSINREVSKDWKVEIAKVDPRQFAEARRTILQGNQPKAEIVATYVPTLLVNQISAESRQITLWLLILAVSLSVLLAAAFWLLWVVFRRHLERERAYEKLDRMAYVGTLTSGLAHEIRNPLNALNLNIQLVGEEIADPRHDSAGRVSKIVELIKKEIARLNTTLTSFLQYALPPSSQTQMTDVVAVLHETASLFEPDMRERSIQYRYEGERSCETLADGAGLRQVFWNVMLNAVQAVEWSERKRIVTRCHVEDGECRIEIRDSGPGVAPDQREKVFEAFYSTRPGGSGFGLAIARQVVSRHRGRIWIDSHDGWGCVVEIRLPLRIRLSQGEVSV